MSAPSLLRRALLCAVLILTLRPPQRGVEPSPVLDVECIQEGHRLVSVPCPDPIGVTRFASARIRRALGEPVCWPTAPAFRLADLPGVGPRLATTLSEYRDAGGRPTQDGLDALPGIGSERALSISSAVDVACYGPRTRRGLRLTQRVQ
ncbi:MAG: hypothetical protein ACJA1R_000475 [Flavobacteriales bacterium]|jgi:hypothetical protein